MSAFSFFRCSGLRPALGAAAMLACVAAMPALALAEDSLNGRVGRLEGQITDLQVMIGTLESLVRAKPAATLQQEAPAAPQAADSGLAPRVEALETQVGAITQQLERISGQLTRIEARLDDAAPQSIAPQQDPQQDEENPPPLRQGQVPGDPRDTGSIYGDTSKPRWFGPPPGADPSQGEHAQTMMTALPAPDAQTLYQQAYGAFMQADYPAAEDGFRSFLAAYPKDALAGSAQYWLGESLYARGDYKGAADAYLKGYKTYKTSDKAPDTLLKLAMSLAALGQKDAACSTFGELDAKFPRASEAVRDQAKDERQKAGC